jgi:hypothetical protein
MAAHPPATAATAATTVAPNTQTNTNAHHPKTQNAPPPSNTANHTASTIAQSNVAKVVVTTNK